MTDNVRLPFFPGLYFNGWLLPLIMIYNNGTKAFRIKAKELGAIKNPFYDQAPTEGRGPDWPVLSNMP